MKTVAVNIVAADHEKPTAEQQYPDVVVDDDNYFEIASENRLGTKQHYQFQPSDVYGTVTEGGESVLYHWGSKCTESDGAITCDSSATPANNELAGMPREYHTDDDAIGGYYNWSYNSYHNIYDIKSHYVQML